LPEPPVGAAVVAAAEPLVPVPVPLLDLPEVVLVAEFEEWEEAWEVSDF